MSLTYLQPSILTSGEAQLPWLLRPPHFLLTQQRQDYNCKVARGIADSQEQSIPALSLLQRVAGEEGASKLYRGLPPALLRQAVYGSIKYGLYYTSKDWFQVCLGLPEESTLLRLLCGVLAGDMFVFFDLQKCHLFFCIKT